MSLSARQKAFFLIALKERPKSVDALFPFIPKAEADELNVLYRELKDRRTEDIVMVAEAEFKKMARPQNRNYLAEVHNDWLIRILKEESPHLIATVLRYLPAERVQAILDGLPMDILRGMPRLADAYATDDRLVDILRRRFESLFEISDFISADQPFDFGYFHLLRSVQIANVFLELGYREIALGLSALPQMTKTMVLGRLLPTDRLRVESYFKKSGEASLQRIKKAQVHLISKEADARHPDFFIKELGYLVYAKALLARDMESLSVLEKKMSFREACALREAVEQYCKSNTEASVLPYREDVLSSVRTVLSGKADSETTVSKL